MINWTEVDKQKLIIAYNMGASLKVMALVLKRSPTAISKALTRFGIRPWGASTKDVKRGTSSFGPVTSRQLLREFHLRLEIAPPSEQEDFLEEENPTSCNALTHKTKGLSKRGSKGWVPLDVVLQFLKKEGYQISAHQQQSYFQRNKNADYLLNQRPYRVEQLLLIANRVRFIHGLEPYLVEGVTQ